MEEKTTEQENKKDEQPEAMKSYQTMPEPKKSGNSKAKMIAVAILVAIIAGGGVWYYMNHKLDTQNKSNQTHVSSLQTQITDLNKAVATQTAAAKTASAAATAATKTANEFDSLKTFCLGTDPNTTVGSIQYVENKNGKFGLCGIGSKIDNSGAMMVSTFLSGKWLKVWSGNGVMDASNCTKYKIPTTIYADCSGNY